MQISEMLGQYNRNVTNGTEELKSAQGTQKLVSTVGELSAGNIFEGTVNSVRGGKVTLALGNGQTITARLEGKVDIRQGSSMFFQVKSNDGTTVSIRPYNGPGNAGNPILTNALTAAQVPVTERSLMMVDAMMQEQMPIGRQSILDMAKILLANPQTNVQTLVQMTKLGLPVTEEMAGQYERYLTDQHAMLGEMELLAGHLTEALADEALSPAEALALFDRLAGIFLQGDAAQAGAEPGLVNGDAVQDGEVSAWNPAELAAGAAAEQADGAELPAGQLMEALAKAESDGAGPLWQETGGASAADGTAQSQTEGGAGAASGGATLANLLTPEQQAALTRVLAEIPALAGNTELFAGADPDVYVNTLTDEAGASAETGATAGTEATPVLNESLTAEEFVGALRHALAQNGAEGMSGMQRLFAGREFQIVFRDMIGQQWLLTPQDLKEENKIGSLYEKLDRQIRQMEAAARLTAGGGSGSLLQAASDVRGNIEFMNQMNQIYNYVQLPLKLSGQHANGELYVYTNKKNLRDPDGELSAFLHLDLEQLGSTDVSVRMKNRQVKANFYMEDDSSYDLIEKHLPILEKRIRNKGYSCSITITNEKKDVNFKENFVKHGRGASVGGGGLHRYSFDVRA